MAISTVPYCCFAQKHDYNWMAGYDNFSSDLLLGGLNIDFNTDPPTIYPEKKKISFGFYAGVCSDSSGNLAFYTNGISIRDTTHNRMLNGDTINPGPIWLDWQHEYYPNGPFCFALPAPGKHNQYFLFHMAAFISNEGHGTSPFYYSIVDMDGNNGLGKVTDKNKLLLPPFKNYIDPVAVKHGNGRDWWIITGEVQKPILHTFLLDPDGVHGPFTTTMPFQFPGTEYQSINDISPDGNTYVRAAGRLGLYIYDFDRCSGTLNNLKALPFANQNFLCFATVFAPDSKHLFLSSWEAVTEIDLSASDISNSLDTLAYFDGKASPQEPFVTGFFIPNLGPDGKIYYATTNGTLSLHVIHNPGLPGVAADVEQHGVSLPKFNSGTMAQFPNYRLGELEGSPCDTLNGQRPGDGFVKTDWYPPTYRKLDEYTLLPPLFQGSKPSGKAPEHIPSMVELAIKRMEEERKGMKLKENDKKN
ncbi:MAG: hypothetical protein KA138_10725 [Saprospiraceae bacterium]|nr:hypothetical protein [Saprospiraceae bacterium]